ncbi:MAG: redoxin domain-containing protein [Acidimicrobiales bacterium]|jgi:hypothetical protein|nr:redoxin domain-containing protein [Acidimicrobiales bacterium]
MLVLANDESTTVDSLPDAGPDLWVRTDQLPEATGWELKPEGACLDELCVPLLGDEKTEWVQEHRGAQWLKYSALADKVGQKYVHDDDVWSLGTVPHARHSTLGSGFAPDFEVTDRDGRAIRLSDLRGKKVLLVTWASW